MDLLYDILVFLHLLGFASLFGGLFVQIKGDPRVVNAAVLHGTLTQAVTGLLLVGVLESGQILNAAGSAVEVDNAKIAVKFLVALVITVLVIANRKKNLPTGLFLGLLGLTVGNVGVAVFWG